MLTALLILTFSLIFVNLILMYRGIVSVNKNLDLYYSIVQKNLDLILSRQSKDSSSFNSILTDNKKSLEEIYKDLNCNYESWYRDLKADVISLTVDILRLESQLNVQKEAPTESPLMPPQKNPRRGRLRLEPETPLTAQQSVAKSSDISP